MQIPVDSCDAPDLGLFKMVRTAHFNTDVRNGKKGREKSRLKQGLESVLSRKAWGKK